MENSVIEVEFVLEFRKYSDLTKNASLFASDDCQRQMSLIN